jgi:hypothetical protein
MRPLFVRLLIFVLSAGAACGDEHYVIKENKEELTHPEDRYRPKWPEGATITSLSGKKLCAKHRTPLVPLRVYEYLDKAGEITLTHDACHMYWGVALEHCPNIIPEGVLEHPSGRMRKPTVVTYCPKCENEFLEALRVPTEKAAVAYATYDLRIRSMGVRTKGPYEITLKGDVWTVRCSLIDGRRGTVRFTKSEGCLISSDLEN